MGVCAVLGVMTWYFSKPHSTRFYEASFESPMIVALTPEIDIALDKRSILAVKEGDPLRAELFVGNVYFDVKNKASHELELKVGQVVIKDIGTRFSVRMRKDGDHQIAVANGQVEIYLASGVFYVNAFEQANFNEHRLDKRMLIHENDIAPWRLLSH
ncbi:FecR family protein [Nitrosomonas sp. PY1]|nr:FecR family protein [Nitrosomonas sp. PY1]